MKGWAEKAVSPPVVVTVIGWKLAPVGTVTLREVELAVVTAAFTDPKKTILADGVLLKLVPLMVTVEPTAPECGLKSLMTGCANAIKGRNSIVNRKT
jgi:hypothetical protein